MKIKNFLAALLGPLFFANGCGSLLPVFADNAAPAIESQKISAAHDTNFTGHVVASGSANHIRLLASALQCQQMNLEVIANNLANVNTTGFKASQLRFQDMTRDQDGQTTLLKGAEPVLTKRLFTQGEITRTRDDLDFAILGNGFFEVQMPDGTLAFTRDGGFKKDSMGRIVTAQGYPVQGGFQPVPRGVTIITITTGGQATYASPGGNTNFQVQLARFENPAGLDAAGASLFKATVASGEPERGNPSENGFGEVYQGYLELSNVSVLQETVNLVLAQRACDATAQALQASEKMMESNLQAKQ